MATRGEPFKGLSYRVIAWKLRDKGMPETLVMQTIEQLKRDRAERTKERAARRVHRTAWDEVIEPLQHERRIVRTMVRYKTAEPAPERDEFVTNYNAVLIKTYERLVNLRNRGGMPEHNHWTDYVPDNIKEAFIQAAADIPPRNRAKMKTPFERTIPMDLHDRRKGRLLRRTRTERLTAESEGNIEKMYKLDEALDRIHALPPNAYVPNTWHGLFDADEMDDV